MGRGCKGLHISHKALRDLEELSQEAKRECQPDMLLRICGVIMVSRHHSYREVAGCLGVTIGTVANWVRTFTHEGAVGLWTKPRTGRPAELTEEELGLLEEWVEAGAQAWGFPNDLWDARRVATLIRAQFGVCYHPHHVAKVLRARGFSVQKPQRVLALADAAAQYRWETHTKPQIARRARVQDATIFFEDEMMVATQSTVQRTWARVGHPPQCQTFGRAPGVKAFGAISNRGHFRYRVQLDYFSHATFRAFLLAFRAATDGYLILILDGAPYHKGAAIQDFVQEPRHAMEVYHLPGYSPHLNPQEHVWKVFRKHYTHNRCFATTAETLAATRSGFRALQRSPVLRGVYTECQRYFAP
jgi:transposase